MAEWRGLGDTVGLVHQGGGIGESEAAQQDGAFFEFLASGCGRIVIEQRSHTAPILAYEWQHGSEERIHRG